ncbi:hypothetical protein BJY00DRAFT_171238 [Aspergillus carlsbadensis]|nr:hypothetical protein BJY00DRAFT_171238 [Aspergillus carlsbadensis]
MPTGLKIIAAHESLAGCTALIFAHFRDGQRQSTDPVSHSWATAISKHPTISPLPIFHVLRVAKAPCTGSNESLRRSFPPISTRVS